MQHEWFRLIPSAALLAVAAAYGAEAAGGGGGPGEGYVAPYALEELDDGERVKITLTERAVGRLGIETAAVTAEEANRSFIIGGDVLTEPPKTMADGEASAPAAPGLWISFPITEAIEDAKHLPIRIRALNGGGGAGLEARPDEGLNRTVTAEGGGMLYYRTVGDVGGLEAGHRVLVEVPFAGNGEPHTVVPYGSIIYDHNGDEWVYVSPEPGVYQREPVDIAYIEGDKAFLLEGPEVGAMVVTVGAAELLGTEQRVGH
ncbi:MAG: hypothetical protein GY798_10090 [Hyphomicrobiales bacterium]|nr:hypothetical protein [Hyphomicrobiales bacterium]